MGLLKTLKKGGALAATLLIFPVTSNAADYHTLGSAPDVYRIEIRNLDLFQVMETGDNDGIGELSSLRVSLGSLDYGQFDEVSDSAGTLYNRTRNDAGNNTSVDVRLNDRVVYGGHESNRDLWIHTKRHKSDGRLNEVSLRVDASEYDCSFNIRCNRGSHGSVTVSFVIPNYATPPSTRCEAGNTYLLSPIDDELGIVGVENVSVQTNGYHPNSHLIPALTKHKTGGIRLRPYNAEICIASTVRPGSAPPPGYVPSRTNPVMKFVQNKGSNRCLSLPSRPITGREAPAYVNDCRMNSSVDVPAKQKWDLAPTGERDIFSIKSTTGNYCLNLKNSVDGRDGGPVKLVACSAHNDQKWRRIRKNGADVQFQNVSSGKCLLVRYPEHKDGGRVAVYTCSDHPNQLWWSTDDATAAETARWRR